MFFKKSLLVIFIGLFALNLTWELKAQSHLDEISNERLEKEGPLTQADFDLYAKFIVFFAKTVKSPDTEKIDDVMDNLANKFVAENRSSLIRLKYIIDKISYGMSEYPNPDLGDPLSNFLNFSAREKLLLSENMPKISAALDEIIFK
jgi:hypothetical protein